MEKQNWEISFDKHLAKFRAIDPEEAARRTNIEFDTEFSRFTIEVLGHKLYAKWPEFELFSEKCQGNVTNHRPLDALCDIQMQVLVMRVLYLGVHAPLSGKFKAYRELPWGDVYDTNFNGRCIKRFAYGFGFNPQSFENAAKQLGGVKCDLGDVSYDFPFFGGITCRFILWKPDDEFPPSAQILFSDNVVLMYNAEDLAAVGDVIIGALKEISKKLM